MQLTFSDDVIELFLQLGVLVVEASCDGGLEGAMLRNMRECSESHGVHAQLLVRLVLPEADGSEEKLVSW